MKTKVNIEGNIFSNKPCFGGLERGDYFTSDDILWIKINCYSAVDLNDGMIRAFKDNSLITKYSEVTIKVKD
jgi:hypothetical protein